MLSCVAYNLGITSALRPNKTNIMKEQKPTIIEMTREQMKIYGLIK